MAKEKEVIIPAINIQTAVIKVVGDSPLIMHKWSEKAKKEMLDKQMKKAKTKGHDAKDPVRDFIDSMYWLEGEPEEKHRRNTKCQNAHCLTNGLMEIA